MSTKASAVKPAKKHAKHVGEETVSLRHDFTDKEYREIGGKLNLSLNELDRLEGELKSISSDYKARIQQQEGQRDELNMKLGNGYEMRQTKVTVVYDPKRGVKTFFALDDKKQKTPLSEEPMRQSDYQVELPIATTPKTTGMAELPSQTPAHQAGLVSVGEVMKAAGQPVDLESEAIEVIRSEGKCSASLLMKRLRIGKGEADGIIESLASRGIIGPTATANGECEVIALPPQSGTPAMDTSNPPPPPEKCKSDKRKPTKAEFTALKEGEGERDK